MTKINDSTYRLTVHDVAMALTDLTLITDLPTGARRRSFIGDDSRQSTTDQAILLLDRAENHNRRAKISQRAKLAEKLTSPADERVSVTAKELAAALSSDMAAVLSGTSSVVLPAEMRAAKILQHVKDNRDPLLDDDEIVIDANHDLWQYKAGRAAITGNQDAGTFLIFGSHIEHAYNLPRRPIRSVEVEKL